MSNIPRRIEKCEWCGVSYDKSQLAFYSDLKLTLCGTCAIFHATNKEILDKEKHTEILPFKWEEIFESKSGVQHLTYRAKVVGGWLILHIMGETGARNISNGMVFISDPDHNWQVKEAEQCQSKNPGQS